MKSCLGTKQGGKGIQDRCCPKDVPVTMGRAIAERLAQCKTTYYPGEGHISLIVNHREEIVTTLLKSSCHAWKDIRQGEEITIDYRLNAFDGGRYECFCGSTNCPGYMINSFFAMSEEQQYLYLPYAPKFIREEHHRRNRPSFSPR
jgi:hypothetical protein